MTWTDITFAYGSILTSSKMTNLDNNFEALANGDSGAPAIQEAAMGAASVNQAALKTSTGSSSTTSVSRPSLTGGYYVMGMKEYFDKYLSNEGICAKGLWNSADNGYGASDNTSAAVYYTLDAGHGQGSSRVYWQYVTASGEVHWIFGLIEKATGNIIALHEAGDHPCFGYGVPPEIFQIPFGGVDFKRFDVFCVPLEKLKAMEISAKRIPIMGGGYANINNLSNVQQDPDRPIKEFLEVFEEQYEIDMLRDGIWPDIPITIDLPKLQDGKIIDDWRFEEKKNIKPLKKTIAKPDFVTVLNLNSRRS